MNKLDRSADASEPASMRLYFAYGANMNAEVLARRLMRESASFRRRRGVLMNHRLVFNKLSSTDPVVGYANVVACPGECVEGLLNELDDGALAQLDAIELVPHHYTRSRLLVHDSLHGELTPAEIYTAHPRWIRPHLMPLRSYLSHLIDAADLLSEDYARTLRLMRCRD
jgi:Gamma-glutamyl cyclotransferase, AIG2-like